MHTKPGRLLYTERMSDDTIRGNLDSPLSLIPLNSGPPALTANKLAAPGALPATPTGARPSVIQLVFREKGALYAAFIPVFTEGGLFVPTTRHYSLGEDVYLLLSLPEDAQRYPVAGKVAWITPANASGGRTQGVGVRFPVDEKTRVLKIKIEGILGTALQSTKPTQTI